MAGQHTPINYHSFFLEKVVVEVSPDHRRATAVLEGVDVTFTVEEDGLYLSYHPGQVGREFTLEIKVTELVLPRTNYNPVSIKISPNEGLSLSSKSERKLGLLSTVRSDPTDILCAANKAKIALTVGQRCQFECKRGTPIIRIKFTSELNPGRIEDMVIDGININQKRLDLLREARMIQLVEGHTSTYTSELINNSLFIMQCFTYTKATSSMLRQLLKTIPANSISCAPLVNLFRSFCQETCARNLLWLNLLCKKVKVLREETLNPCQDMLLAIKRKSSSVIQQQFLEESHLWTSRVRAFYDNDVRTLDAFNYDTTGCDEEPNDGNPNAIAPIVRNYYSETQTSQKFDLSLKIPQRIVFVGGIEFKVQLRDTGFYIMYKPGEVVKEVQYRIDVWLKNADLKYDPMYLTVKRYKGFEWNYSETRYGWKEHYMLDSVRGLKLDVIRPIIGCYSNNIGVRISLNENWKPIKEKKKPWRKILKRNDTTKFLYTVNVGGREQSYSTKILDRYIDDNTFEMILKSSLRLGFIWYRDRKDVINYRKSPDELRAFVQFLTYNKDNDWTTKLAFDACHGRPSDIQQKIMKQLIKSNEGAKMMVYACRGEIREVPMKVIYMTHIKSREESMQFQMDYMRYCEDGTSYDRLILKKMFDVVEEWMVNGVEIMDTLGFMDGGGTDVPKEEDKQERRELKESKIEEERKERSVSEFSMVDAREVQVEQEEAVDQQQPEVEPMNLRGNLHGDSHGLRGLFNTARQFFTGRRR